MRERRGRLGKDTKKPWKTGRNKQNRRAERERQKTEPRMVENKNPGGEKRKKNWGLKGGETVGFWMRNQGKTSAKPRQKTRGENQSKEERKSIAQIQSNNTQIDGENKKAAIHRDEYWLCHCLRPCKQRKPRIKTNSQQERTNICHRLRPFHR